MDELLRATDELQARIDGLRPLSPEEARQLRAYYRIGLTWSSNALEGNTLTESETRVVVEDGLTIGGRSLREHMEAVGHAEACDAMHELAAGSLFTEPDILRLHWLIYHRIDEAQAGRWRSDRVFVTGSRHAFPPPEEVPSLMAEWLAGLPALRDAEHPVVFAARLHQGFTAIHPFVDANGHVARLLMNLVLLQAGRLPTIIPPILRVDYIAALERAHVNDKPFIKLILRCHVEAQKEFARLAK